MDIRFFGDLTWFSQKSTKESYGSVVNALKSHIRYISNSKREDLLYTENLEFEKWKKLAEQETKKRWDSRVAGKFVIALPNSFDTETAVKFVKEFVEKEFNVKTYGFAIHRSTGVSGRENLHAHIVLYPVDKNNRKLRIDKKRLSEIQRAYDEYIKRYTGKEPKRNRFEEDRMTKKLRPWHFRAQKFKSDANLVMIHRSMARDLIRQANRIERLYREALQTREREELNNSQEFERQDRQDKPKNPFKPKL